MDDRRRDRGGAEQNSACRARSPAPPYSSSRWAGARVSFGHRLGRRARPRGGLQERHGPCAGPLGFRGWTDDAGVGRCRGRSLASWPRPRQGPRRYYPGTGDPRARLPPHQPGSAGGSVAKGRAGPGADDMALEAAERAAAAEAQHVVAGTAPADDTEAPPEDLATATHRALAALPGRSPRLEVCPFLRAGEGPNTAPADRPNAAQHRWAFA